MPNPLASVWNTRLRSIRIILWTLYIFALAWGVFLILFPSKEFLYDFRSAKKNLNTLLDPRSASGGPLGNGKITADGSLLFDTALKGEYSTATVFLTRDRESPLLEHAPVTARKSYRAFFYPLSKQSALWTAGTLFTSDNRYYIVDDQEHLRSFASLAHAERLGFNSTGFISITSTEINSNILGEPLQETEYPSGTLFFIDGNYYALAQDGLRRFVSETAYLSRYAAAQAVSIPADFHENKVTFSFTPSSSLVEYPLSEDWLGFRNGSLLAFADGVFIVNGDIIQPFGSPEIFLGLGFAWENIIPASEEDIGIYKRGKIAIMDTPHPDGTIFHDRDTDRYFLIRSQMKESIESPALLALLLRHQSPIEVSSRALDITAVCALEPRFFSRAASCTLPLETFRDLPGNAFQFSTTLPPEANLSQARVSFESSINQHNLLYALSQIKQRIFNHYGYGLSQ